MNYEIMIIVNSLKGMQSRTWQNDNPGYDIMQLRYDWGCAFARKWWQANGQLFCSGIQESY